MNFEGGGALHWPPHRVARRLAGVVGVVPLAVAQVHLQHRLHVAHQVLVGERLRFERLHFKRGLLSMSCPVLLDGCPVAEPRDVADWIALDHTFQL